MADSYYTAKEAMSVLRKPYTSFYREVREGKIPHKGKRPKLMFPKEAIDALAELEINKEEENKLTFTLSTIADAWTKQEMVEELLKSENQPYDEEDGVPFKTIVAWRKRNEEISMNVKEDNKILGWVTFLPLEEEVIHSLINNEIKEKDIPLQAIKKWTDSNLSVYVPIIEVIPTKSALRDKLVGEYLIRNTIRWAVSLMLRYDIKNWYSIGTSPEGQEISEKLGFKLIADQDSGERKGYVLEGNINHVKLISKIFEHVEKEDNKTH